MYMWPLLVTGSETKRTVQIGISMLNSVDAQSITLMIAGVVIIIIPSISIFDLTNKACYVFLNLPLANCTFPLNAPCLPIRE